jgi:hypothetical protein
MNALLECSGGSVPGSIGSRFVATLHIALCGNRYSDCQRGGLRTAALTVTRSNRRQP